MTLEELLNKSADDWEKLTDAELERWAMQFYHVTRPTKIVKSELKQIGRKQAASNSLINQALALAKQYGIQPKTK